MALGVVCCSSLLIDSARVKLDRFEIVHPFLLLWFVYFGLSTLYILYDSRAAYDSRVYPWLDLSILLCIGSAAAFLYGYVLSRRFAAVSARPREIRGTLWILAVYLIGLVGGGAVVLAERQMIATSRVTGFVSLFEHFEFLSNFGYFLLVYQWLRGKATPSQKIALVAVVLPGQALLLLLHLGGKLYTLTILGLPLIALAYARGRLPAKSIIAILLIAVFIIFPLYGTFRTTSRNYSVGTRISKSVDSLTSLTPDTYTQFSIFTVGNRMALINSVAVVLAETGRSVDYQYGRTFGEIFIVLVIPRVFWPDKPDLNIAKEFGREFRILPRWNMNTYVAITPVGELYWNFGVPGVIGGMFLLGICLQRIYAMLGQAGLRDPLRLAMYVGILPLLMSYEGGLSAWSVQVLRCLAAYLVLGWFCRTAGFSLSDTAAVPETHVPSAGAASLAPG